MRGHERAQLEDDIQIKLERRVNQLTGVGLTLVERAALLDSRSRVVFVGDHGFTAETHDLPGLYGA